MASARPAARGKRREPSARLVRVTPTVRGEVRAPRTHRSEQTLDILRDYIRQILQTVKGQMLKLDLPGANAGGLTAYRGYIEVLVGSMLDAVLELPLPDGEKLAKMVERHRVQNKASAKASLAAAPPIVETPPEVAPVSDGIVAAEYTIPTDAIPEIPQPLASAAEDVVPETVPADTTVLEQLIAVPIDQAVSMDQPSLIGPEETADQQVEQAPLSEQAPPSEEDPQVFRLPKRQRTGPLASEEQTTTNELSDNQGSASAVQS